MREWDQQITNLSQYEISERLQHPNWKVRKECYDQILYLLQQGIEPFYIGKAEYTTQKLIPYLNNLAGERHPTVLLGGMQCVQVILRKNEAWGKHLLKLCCQGLEKFPLISQQRKLVLQKFVDLLSLIEIQPKLIRQKLNSPHQKSVMFILEVIGVLNMRALVNDIKEIINHHVKKCVRDLAAEILQQLQPYSTQQNVNFNQPNKALKNHPKNQSKKNDQRCQLVERLSQYDNLTPKEQQAFSGEILQNLKYVINSLSSTVDFGYYIRLMIEDNNHIISTNGIKILMEWFKNYPSTLPQSYPLLFVLEKFKMHSTHPINSILYQFCDCALLAGRANDLLQSLSEGITSNKANVKFGASILYIRLISIAYQNHQLFQLVFGAQLPQIEVNAQKLSEKYLYRCCQVLSEDKKYKKHCEIIRSIIGYPIQAKSSYQSTKSTGYPIQTKYQSNKSANKLTNNPKTKPIPKAIDPDSFNPQKFCQKILNECQLNLQTLKGSLSTFTNQIEKGLSCHKYQLFYVCEILEYFVRNYIPSESTTHLVSQFLIDILTIISKSQFNTNKKQHHHALSIILRISICQIVLGSNLQTILNHLLQQQTIKVLLPIIETLPKVRKKNRTILVEWLNQHTPLQLLNQQFYQLIARITSGSNLFLQPIPHLHPYTPIQNATYKPTEKLTQKIISKVTQKSNEEIRFQMNDECELQESLDKKWGYYMKKHQLSSEKQSEEKQITTARFIEHKSHREPIPHNSIKQSDYHSIPCIQNGSQNYNNQSHTKQSLEPTSNIINQPRIDSILNLPTYSNLQPSIQKIDNKNVYYFTKDIQQSSDQQLSAEYNLKNEQEQKKYNNFFLNHQNPITQYKHVEKQQQEEQLSIQNQEQPIQYQLLNIEKLNYMLSCTANPYPHLRNLILIPFKSQHRKHQFLDEFTKYMANYELKMPQPYNAILLIVILLFSQIKNDKTLIGPLQDLYQHLASLFSSNEFIRTVLSLLHNVIQEASQSNRAFLVTILSKSIERMVPFVENNLQLMIDYQQFYQIGQMFQLYESEYSLIQTTIEGPSLKQAVTKSYNTQKELLHQIVDGWLETAFKLKVQVYMKSIAK